MNTTTTTTTTMNTTTMNMNKNGGKTNMFAELIANAQNGYIRDRKHEKVAVWELKMAIAEHFPKNNHAPIVLALGNWMVCAGYAIMNYSDAEFYALADRVIAFCVNGIHITAQNKQGNARADVFSSARVKGACYRAVMCDFDLNVRKEENKPVVKASKAKTSKKEERIIRIMDKFGCTREVAEEMAM